MKFAFILAPGKKLSCDIGEFIWCQTFRIQKFYSTYFRDTTLEHVHELSNDIIAPLEGKARIWIQGIGEFEMRRGVVINVPKGVKHNIFDATEDVFAFDVFNPDIG